VVRLNRAVAKARIKEKDLSNWKLLEDFGQRLDAALAAQPLHPSWENPQRRLDAAQYLSLFLFGLLNPVLTSMRGLCRASHLPRVQEEVSSRPASLGAFSEAQHIADPQLLKTIFSTLRREVRQRSPQPEPAAGGAPWLRLMEVVDSTLWHVLPRMHWALWRHQGVRQNTVRLHVKYHVWESLPSDVALTTGKVCERFQWEQMAQPGEFYVGDRYFGEDYQLLQRLMDKPCQFAVRLRQSAQWQVEQALPVSPADQKADVLEDLWVRLGSEAQGPRLRIVRILGPEEDIVIATNVGPAQMSADLVALCYRHRWEVELFFRWLKYVMGSNHWMAESPRGVAVQIYLTLIGAQLLLLYTGQRPNKRMMEALQFYLMGWASAEEVMALLQKALPRKKK
jgi:hypothetical protein